MVPPLAIQIWTASGVVLNVFGLGMVLSYSSCLLPGLMAADSKIKIDLETGSWLASSVGLSSMLGCLVSSYAMDRWGRRVAHIVMVIPCILGWLVVYFASNVTMLMIGRISSGLSIGATTILGAVIVGEYTSPENRGLFLTIKNTAVYMGTTVLHILANYYHWRTVALIGSVPGILSLLITCTLTESPSWLASKNQFKKSEETFYYLRGYTDKSIKEFEAMVKAQKAVNIADEKRTLQAAVLDYFRRITQKKFLKPLVVVTVAFILVEAGGRHTFSAYAVDIIRNISSVRANTFTYTLCIDILSASSATFSCFLVKRMKRRKLLFFSALSCIIMSILLSAYLCLVDNQVISATRAWIPISMLASLFIFANLGCSPIPLALLGELFPLSHRAVGSGVSGFTTSLILLLALKLLPSLMVLVNLSGTFAVTAAVIAASVVYLYFTLPETKDRTLQEIEEFFEHGRFVDDDEELMIKSKVDGLVASP